MIRKILSILLLLITFVMTLDAQVKNTSEINLITEDKQTISATYIFPEIEADTYPVIVMIHQGGSSKEEWIALPIKNHLLNEGYALFAFDIRMHGKSSKDIEDTMSIFKLFDDPNRAPKDLEAVIKFLKEDTRIDNNRIGIMGASVGANLACVGSATTD